MLEAFYVDNHVAQYCGNSAIVLRQFQDACFDELVTDPPYGISFMGKDWDKALPDPEVWKQCLRVLKPGAFAFVMCIPRADCLSRMIISLEDAGFRVDFSPIYWCFASGFPKAQNIGKAVDKRFGVEREVIGKRSDGRYRYGFTEQAKKAMGSIVDEKSQGFKGEIGVIDKPATPQAKALDGSYGGFQPKPAVEVIIVAMKPLSEKTFVDQALKNWKGITWLDDCRVPYESEYDKSQATPQGKCTGQVFDGMLGRERNEFDRPEQRGRFPANLLVSDGVLKDGEITKQGKFKPRSNNRTATQFEPSKGWHDHNMNPNNAFAPDDYGDSGTFSRYFDLDKWWEERINQLPKSVRDTFPFLIVPKAGKAEKDAGLDVATVVKTGLPLRDGSGDYAENVGGDGSMPTRRTRAKNIHPTVKPVELMSYLITLGSRDGDAVLDPFSGSGTTLVAGKALNRKIVGIDIKKGYCEITVERCRQIMMDVEVGEVTPEPEQADGIPLWMKG